MNKYTRFLLILLLICLLQACGSLTAEEVLEEAEKLHEDVSSYQLEYNEKFGPDGQKGTLLSNVKEEQYEVKLSENERLYMDKEVVLLEGQDGYVLEAPESMSKKITETVEFFNNPLKQFASYKKDYAEMFDLEEKEDTIELTLKDEVDEEELFDFAESYLEQVAGDQYVEVEVESFDIELVLSEESKLLEKVKVKSKFEERGHSIKSVQTFVLSDYDDIDEIEPAEKLDIEALMEDDSEVGESIQYLDALIQATVFQNEKEFVKRAPDSMSKKEKEKEAKLQKETFRSFYIENTKNNMEGLDIPDKKFEKLADALIESLSRTSYEIIDVEEFAGDVIVTLQIEGLDGPAMSQQIEKEMIAALSEQEMSDEELINLNLDLLIEGHKNMDIAPPTQVDVTVYKLADEYNVQQDEFLINGFVHQ